MNKVKVFCLFSFLMTFLLLNCNKRESDQIRFAMASARGDMNLVKKLINNKNVNVNGLNGEMGPALVSSSYGGYKEIVSLLLDNGADINIRDTRGGTPLMNAVIGQKEEIVRLLLEKGANPNLVAFDKNGIETNTTALTFAKMKQNKTIISLLEKATKTKE